MCGDVPEHVGRVWHLTFNGAPGVSALLGSLLNQCSPVAAITEAGKPIAVWRLGTDGPGGLVAVYEGMLHRTTMLIVTALTGGRAPNDCLFANHRRGVVATKALVYSVSRHICRLCCTATHWRIGWRRLGGPAAALSRGGLARAEG